jgi:cell division protein FtsB
MVLLVILIFFENTNLYQLYLYKQEYKTLLKENAEKELEIKEIARKTHELTSNPEALETFARETYFMKKPNETVFIFLDASEIEE